VEGHIQQNNRESFYLILLLLQSFHNQEHHLFQYQQENPRIMTNENDYRTFDRRKRGVSLISEVAPLVNLDRTEILSYLELFNKFCNEQGLIDFENFTKVMNEIGVTDSFKNERNFFAWDSDKDGYISQKEFLLGVSIVLRGTLEERLRLAYTVYDLDQDGLINYAEMQELLQRVLGMKYNFTTGDYQVMVLDLFQLVGIGRDDALGYENFVRAIKSNRMILDCFAGYVPPPPPRRKSSVFDMEKTN